MQSDGGDPATTDIIRNFMSQFYRFGNQVLLNSISWKVDLEKMGGEFKCFTDSLGIDREYIVYIPQEHRSSNQKLPIELRKLSLGKFSRIPSLYFSKRMSPTRSRELRLRKEITCTKRDYSAL